MVKQIEKNVHCKIQVVDIWVFNGQSSRLFYMFEIFQNTILYKKTNTKDDLS